MSHLTVWKFDTADGAEAVLDKFQSLQKEHLAELIDAAIVTWPSDKKRPRTRQALNLPLTGALDGTFWGMLFGLLFFVPLVGAAVGAALGALAGAFADYGIDDDLIKKVRAEVGPGTSALFLLTTRETPDRILEVFQSTPMKLIQSNLSRDQEAMLRHAFQQ